VPPIVYLNGSYLDKGQAHISPDDRGFLFGDGIYDVGRAYGGKFFALDRHLKRMADGLAALRIRGIDAHDLEPVCHELLERNGLAQSDAIVYLQVTRGVAPRTHAFPESHVEPTVYGTVNPLKPKGDPAVGVGVITAPDLRWARCDVKSIALLANCMAAQAARESGVADAVLLRDGVALEGTHTSFFGVIDGIVRTAPLTNYILPGITRAILLEICKEAAIPHREFPVLQHELRSADELFLAGTTTEVMPIVSVDGQMVADGKPGSVAGRLLGLLRERAVRR